ncbi:MAG: ABC transporter substrate-binding protein [Solirubrobacteraceae bacterium]
MIRYLSTRAPVAAACALVLACALAIAACGSTSSRPAAPAAPGAHVASAGSPVNGGILKAGEATDPDHLDPALSYTTESWEMLEATNNGLVGFAPAAGTAGNRVVPILATALPKVSDHGLTYTFHVRTNVRFSPPVNRDVEPSDVKFSIERLFRANSPGLSYYTEIAGSGRYAKRRKGGISGIVANDRAHTVSFHLTQRDGTFLEYLAMPFAFVVPKGTPNSDISTDSKWRVATGPYMISSYVPQSHITIVRNPNFRSWSRYVPAGHLAGIHVTLGVSPDQAVNETADGQLQWYFEAVAPDRLAELLARYRSQVHQYTRNALLYFSLNMRKAPFNNALVRKALNCAVNRPALVKIYGGQGSPTENLLPPGIAGYAAHHFYPYNLAKAKRLVAASHTKGMPVQIWAPGTDPDPAAAEYIASVLDSLGYKASVKTLNESIYYDTVSNEATNPQVSYNEWDQDFPEGDDFVEGLTDGADISNTGNNDTANINVASVNAKIAAAKQLPLGAKRNAMWRALDAQIMRDYAPYVPFMARSFPKFEAANLHGQVFNPTFYELFPSMWLSK